MQPAGRLLCRWFWPRRGVARPCRLGVLIRFLNLGVRSRRSAPLDATHVNLRMIAAENEIMRAENFDDELAEQEREENRANDRTFCKIYADAKKPFDEVAVQSATNGSRMPGRVVELVEALQKGGAFWTLARNLYERMATRPVDDATQALLC
jgi:hypothetical protein